MLKRLEIIIYTATIQDHSLNAASPSVDLYISSL